METTKKTREWGVYRWLGHRVVLFFGGNDLLTNIPKTLTETIVYVYLSHGHHPCSADSLVIWAPSQKVT